MLKPFCSCGVTRRNFLASIAGLGASTILPSQAADPTIVGKQDRIDTHHHFISPGIKAAMSSKNLMQGPAISWTLQKTLDDMDAAGTATAILSATTPQVSFLSPNDANSIARENNEYAAKLRGDYKGLAYALDVLKADGIGLLTSYGDKWLGHPKFAPVMDEINRRGAILYTHPTSADCCNNLIPNTPPTVVEYGTDTTRTIVDVVFSGTAARCPNIKFIFSHAGGSLPFLTERLQKMPVIDKKLQEKVPNGVMHELQRFYYDTAWAANPYTLSSLLQLVSKDQVLYGSDYPYRTSEDNVKGLLKYGFNEKDMTQITRGNAIKLMPRLA